MRRLLCESEGASESMMDSDRTGSPIRDVAVPSLTVALLLLGACTTSEGKAAVNGDFVMTAGEVSDVIRALENGGIEVVAVHNHMLSEEPRLFFLHYWANNDAVKLARVCARHSTRPIRVHRPGSGKLGR